MNEKRIMVSTNTKLLGDKMLNIIDRINLGENPNAGLKDLKDYVYETWKYVAWNNELFFIDLSKGKRNTYERSEDLAAMAVASVYRESTGCMDGYGVASDVLVKALMPTTENGIAIWNAAVLSCRTYQPVQDVLHDLLIGDLVKKQYGRWLNTRGTKYTATSDGTPAEEIKPEDMSERDRKIFEEFRQEQQKIIEGEFKEVDNVKPEVKAETTASETKSTDNQDVKPETDVKVGEETPAPGTKPEVKTEETSDDSHSKPADNGDAKQEEKAADAPTSSAPDQKKGGNNKKNPGDKKKGNSNQQKKPDKKVESVATVDPAEMEHPEDDKPEDVPRDSITGMPIVMKGFPSMTEGVVIEDSKPVVENISPFFDNNAEYERHFPRLTEFSSLLSKEGFCCIYHFTVACPAVEILMVDVRKLSDPQTNVKWLLIDPDLLYRTGYNVMTCSANGHVLAETFCSLDDTTMVMKIVRGTLNRKDRKALAKSRPSYLRKVYELVDFTAIRNHEPLKEGEWKKLLANLNNVINEQNITKRVQLQNYRNPDQFVLLCHSAIMPMSRVVEAYATILEEGQPAFVIDYNPKYYDTDDWKDTEGNSKNDQYHVFNMADMKPADQKVEMDRQRATFCNPDAKTA